MRSIRTSEKQVRAMSAENQKLAEEVAGLRGGTETAAKKTAAKKQVHRAARVTTNKKSAPTEAQKKAAKAEGDRQALRNDEEAAKRPSPGSSKKSEATNLPRARVNKNK